MPLRLNYTVLSLLGFLAFAAFACAAVLNANSLWAGITFNVAICATFLAAAGTICRRGEARGFSLCFLVFGGGYLVLSFGPWFSTEVRPYLLTSHLVSSLYDKVRRIEPRVASGVTVYLAHSGRVFVDNEDVAPEEIPQQLRGTAPNDLYVYEDDPAGITDPDYLRARHAFWDSLRGRYTSANTADAASVSVPKRTQFDRVCHSLWALVFAVIGGLIARWFQRRESETGLRIPARPLGSG
jgi:hypothetical protein